jgi:Asp-tRNA(Asn)/Glu-tRNA(Gln) amidotransferase A subunit family amidase
LTVAAARALPFTQYADHDAVGLALLVDKGEVDPSELLASACARLEEVNPALNAVVLDHSALARRQIADGLPNGPLRGVPFLLKDLFVELAGTVTTSGSALFRDRRAARDSTVVERYRRAGLVFLGKTHSPELGASSATESRLWGATRNPWNPALSPGGSSGGSAAAVAAGVVPAAGASDAGGSINIPASACGLFGLKPTRGRVPLGPGRYEGGGGLAVLHAITRSVRDSAALLDATAGAEPGSLYGVPPLEGPLLGSLQTPPPRLRIALMERPLSGEAVDPACQKAAEQAAELCMAFGHDVAPAAPSIDGEQLANATGALHGASLAGLVEAAEALSGRPVVASDVEPATWQRLARGRTVTGAQVLAARETLFQTARHVAAFMERFDVILSPTMAGLPPPIGALGPDRSFDEVMAGNRRCNAFTSLYNATGQPAMSVPLSWTDDQIPVGTLFAGRFGEEALLLRLAAELERAADWSRRRPRMRP